MGNLKLNLCSSIDRKELKSSQIKSRALKKCLQYKIQNSDYTFEISPNDNYLAYKIAFDKIRIIKQKNCQNKLTLYSKKNQNISCVGYFQNNQILFCVIRNLRILFFRKETKYKQIGSIDSQNGCINDIITSKSQILTCCEDCSIIITDFNKKNQLLRISNKFSIAYIAFDSQQQVIISYSFDMSIKCYQINGVKIIDYFDSTFYQQIQLINNTNYLIARSHILVVLFQIDYQQRKLDKLKEFKNPNIIYRMSSLYQSEIILVDSKELIVLDIADLNIISRQKHQVKNILYDKNSKLMNSNNFLAITSFVKHVFIGQITIFKLMI